MTRCCLIQKEKTRFNLVKKNSLKFKFFKNIISNSNSTFLQRYNAQKKLQKLPRNSSKVRLRKSCLITGRARSVFRNFGVSRFIIRELAFTAKIPGIYKIC